VGLDGDGTVAQMIRSGAALGEIQDRIDQIPELGNQARAAFWLYAWSHQGGEARRVLLHYMDSRQGRN
jgi:hypothetical protein